jgi:uncharacterized repeat protein (TIGR02543 family)
MPFLRLVVFALFAFSFARAACTDFEIFANGKSLGCGNPVSVEITYRDPLILSIDPKDGKIEWKATDLIAIDTTNYTYIPIQKNIDGTITYIVERNGVSKTININMHSSYIVSFNTDGGTPAIIPPQIVQKNGIAKAPTETLTKIGYDFDGWDFDFSIPIIKDTTVKAKWKIKILTVTFNSDGSFLTSQNVNYNSTASPPATLPTKANYDLDGWLLNGSKYNLNTPVKEDITLNANWVPHPYTITCNANGGTASCPQSYTIESPLITLPAPVRTGYDFNGWFDNPGPSGIAVPTIPAGSTGEKNFYAKWTPHPYSITCNANGGTASCPQSYTIESPPITLPEPTRASCDFSGWFEKSDFSGAAVTAIPTGSIGDKTYYAKWTITFDISVAVEGKEYDGTTTAKITNISFTPAGIITENDYSASANFANPDIGPQNVTLNLTWNNSSSQNYKPVTGNIAPISATITKAKTLLDIDVKDYELSDRIPPKIIKEKTSPYIKDSDVRYEYKREDSVKFSIQIPNRIGTWTVMATVDETANYEGKTVEKSFVVIRGNATTVLHNIAFDTTGFYLDSAMTGKQRRYYVAGSSLCSIKSTVIYITIIEPYIYLREGKKGENMQIESHPEADGLHYKIPFSFGKPGVDTLFYELHSEDNKYSELDTILIETPVPFDTVVGQKWNNVLFVNNNRQTNGGYEFTDFKWFRNNDEISIGNLQYYSAGPSNADALDPSDIYKIVMQTKEGIRISTCEGNATIKVPAQTLKPALKKQVFGIREKSLNSGSKVYNLNGKLTKETSAGVYIVEE